MAEFHGRDVAGFGDKDYDPYRQQIVAEALRNSCSSMMLVLQADRQGGGNAQVKPYLDAANVYFQVCAVSFSGSGGRC